MLIVHLERLLADVFDELVECFKVLVVDEFVSVDARRLVHPQPHGVQLGARALRRREEQALEKQSRDRGNQAMETDEARNV